MKSIQYKRIYLFLIGFGIALFNYTSEGVCSRFILAPDPDDIARKGQWKWEYREADGYIDHKNAYIGTLTLKEGGVTWTGNWEILFNTSLKNRPNPPKPPSFKHCEPQLLQVENDDLICIYDVIEAYKPQAPFVGCHAFLTLETKMKNCTVTVINGVRGFNCPSE